MTYELPAALTEQLDAITLDPHRPLVICDADDVLFHFFDGFLAHIEAEGLYFSWASFGFAGNVLRREDNAALEAELVREKLDGFFAQHTEALEPVEGAADALAHLVSRGAQVVILTNLPITSRDQRARALAKAGMDYPLVVNTGPKGPAVAALSETVEAPVFFIDDLGHHHRSVGKSACHVTRLHFVSNERLGALQGPVDDCHHRPTNWDEIRRLVERVLEERAA